MVSPRHEYNKKWRDNNREYDNMRKRQWRAANRKRSVEIVYKSQKRKHHILFGILDQIKSYNSCCICSETDPVVLEFHHKDSKTKSFGISYAVISNYNTNLILMEIEKCMCICKNCHARVHAHTIEQPIIKLNIPDNLRLSLTSTIKHRNNIDGMNVS